MKMTAEELKRHFGLTGHVENGAFLETHYSCAGRERPASGSICYYVGPKEITAFHFIDCDEYWCYTAGSPLQVWQIDHEGHVSRSVLGIEDGCVPHLYLKKGTIFASRHENGTEEGTFLSCITVPRFQYEGFHMVEEDEIRRKCPETAAFFIPVE